jgi:hypothetical protein
MTAGGSFDPSSDDELMAALGRALQHQDPVPDDVVEAAKATFAWRTIDAELAALTFDSVADADALVGVRSGGGGGPRALTFEYEDVVVEVEVTEHGGRRSLVGHVAPAPLDWVEVHQGGRTEAVRHEADAHGRFQVPDLVAGPFRLLCRFGTGARWPVMLTEWVTI